MVCEDANHPPLTISLETPVSVKVFNHFGLAEVIIPNGMSGFPKWINFSRTECKTTKKGK